MPRKPRTLKMKKLAAGVAKGLSLTEAGKRAGYSNRQAASRAFKVIKLRFASALEAAGYNVDKEITIIYAKIRQKMDAKETIFFQSNGIVMETREVIAHDIQLRAANGAARLIGAIGNGHDDGEPPPVGLRAGHISITVALAPGVDPRILSEIGAANLAGAEQPVLDLESHQDQRLPGPNPTL